MHAETRHEIEDTERSRPHVRLCHRLLREALASGCTTVALGRPPEGMPTARAERGGSWTPLMEFPPAVYGQLVDYFKHMAGVTPGQHRAHGTILVRATGRDASIALSARQNDQGVDELVLRFPTASTGNAAT